MWQAFNITPFFWRQTLKPGTQVFCEPLSICYPMFFFSFPTICLFILLWYFGLRPKCPAKKNAQKTNICQRLGRESQSACANTIYLQTTALTFILVCGNLDRQDIISLFRSSSMNVSTNFQRSKFEVDLRPWKYMEFYLVARKLVEASMA